MRKLIFVLCSLCLAYSVAAQEAVDLGLSVKWASCNVGAASESDYGSYFAWGELSEKAEYTLENYKYWDSGEKPEEIQMKKYVTVEDRKNFDGKGVLEACDDPAAVLCGTGWRVPTQKEWKELLDACSWTWSESGGHQGYTVTSRKNGNSIFLPAGGYKFNAVCQDEGRFGYYWTSSLNISNIDLTTIIMFYNWDAKVYFIRRSAGLTVRGVKE